MRYSWVLKTTCRTCLCWYFCIKEISNIQLTNKGQPQATMTASGSKNQKGHCKKWIWSNKNPFYFITSQEPWWAQTPLWWMLLYSQFMNQTCFSMSKKVHANNVITASVQHYLRQWEVWKFYMLPLLLLKVALLPWQLLNHLGVC